MPRVRTLPNDEPEDIETMKAGEAPETKPIECENCGSTVDPDEPCGCPVIEELEPR